MPRRSVELSIPASGDYVVLARTAAAAVASRLDFTLDRLEDLRLAVDEAAALLLAAAAPDSTLVVRFVPDDDQAGLEVQVVAAGATGPVPGPGTFAWTVLTALVDEVRVEGGPEGVGIVLRTRRDVAVQA